MDTVYLICLLVGGFFVALSLLGNGDSHGGGVDADVDADLALDVDMDGGSVGHGSSGGVGTTLVDLFSIRALFLFSAFFGLTGTMLSLLDTGEPYTVLVSALVGLIVGLGGNYVIRRIGYERVSSTLEVDDLQGRTATVLLPFEGDHKGKISVVAGGQRLQVMARSFGGGEQELFRKGEEVVVVRMNGAIAEVVKPE